VARELPQGHKDDEGKLPLDLISPWLLHGTAKVLQFGAEKYDAYNWAKGILFSRVFSAMQRHLWEYWHGEINDEETGLPHLWHASCCLMFLIHYEANPQLYGEFNDKPNYQEIATRRDTTEELSRSRRLSGEDPQPIVTPQSLDAHRVRGPHEVGATERGTARSDGE